MVTHKIEQLSIKSDVCYLSMPQLDYKVGRDFFIVLFRSKMLPGRDSLHGQQGKDTGNQLTSNISDLQSHYLAIQEMDPQDTGKTMYFSSSPRVGWLYTATTFDLAILNTLHKLLKQLLFFLFFGRAACGILVP